MESPNNGGDKAPARHLSPPNETSNTDNWLHLIGFWPKGTHGNPQTTQVIAKAIGCSPQTEYKYLLLNTAHILLNEHEVELVPTKSLHHSDQGLGHWMVFCMLPGEKGKH